QVGVEGFAQHFHLLDPQSLEGFAGFFQRHGDALLVVLVGAGGIGCHFQSVQNGDDLAHRVGDAVVELLVGLPAGGLAVVVVLGGHPQQLVLELGGVLFGGVQLGLQGLGLAVLLVEPAVLFLGFVLGGLSLGGCGGLAGPGAGRSGLFCRRLGAAVLDLVRLRGAGFGLRGLFGFFAHLRSSLFGHGLPRYGAAC